ncbi:MAG TPA: hypothetical protein VEX68_14960 [Bryobacteraceae bacterium]|nr:hypothetical protein [Bryobacteraceae bacterium]
MKSAGQILEGISLVWWPTVLRSLAQDEEIDSGGTKPAGEGYKAPVQMSQSSNSMATVVRNVSSDKC